MNVCLDVFVSSSAKDHRNISSLRLFSTHAMSMRTASKLFCGLVATTLFQIGFSTPSHAVWVGDAAVIVDPLGEDISGPYPPVNNGFSNGGWFSTNIGHESVAHDAPTPSNSYQYSGWCEQHHFNRHYTWIDDGEENGISYVVPIWIHGEISGARSNGYAYASSNISFMDSDWLGASTSPWQSSYQQGKDQKLSFAATSNQFTSHWVTYSSATGGRPNLSGYYLSWAKTALNDVPSF